ncbi:acryloyl-CoA reductase [Limnobacter litoralis]|uniref:Alcohol dehydrogenase n=1 Tax=Limnobacter litoralis TaxID=481366 RepID=A0ABQ5YQH0_9BURK|nr:acryloyl-CoA reductase [Limnobacter litoralis]GLR25481.1 alcohol dehydrogenase [Limnobacter litoralis]
MKAWKSEQADQQEASLCDVEAVEFDSEEVLIRVQYSCLNYKDALALTHSAPIARTYPMVHGIDAVGVVHRSADARWPVGTLCQVNDWGLGETHWGGLSGWLGVPAHWLSAVPEGRSARWAASLGTAGYTAALCVMAVLDHGVKPEDGPVLVTGVTGGVGTVSCMLLKSMGYEVVGLTGSLDATGEPSSPGAAAHFESLGLESTHLIHRDSFSRPGKPLQKEHFAAVVDSVGSHTLANACAQTRYGGMVAACGLAQGMDFQSSVAPFILRGITLRGINCVYRTHEDRDRAWAMLAACFGEHDVNWMIQEVPLAQALDTARELLANTIQGRVVVNCG